MANSFTTTEVKMYNFEATEEKLETLEETMINIGCNNYQVIQTTTVGTLESGPLRYPRRVLSTNGEREPHQNPQAPETDDMDLPNEGDMGDVPQEEVRFNHELDLGMDDEHDNLMEHIDDNIEVDSIEEDRVFQNNRNHNNNISNQRLVVTFKKDANAPLSATPAPEGAFRCEVCKKNFQLGKRTMNKVMLDHLSKHLDGLELFDCGSCEKKLKTMRRKEYHYKTHHRDVKKEERNEKLTLENYPFAKKEFKDVAKRCYGGFFSYGRK